MSDKCLTGNRTDAEIVKGALAQMATKPSVPNSMVLVVNGASMPVAFAGVIGEMDATGVFNGCENRITKGQVKLGTLQIENRAAEAEEMRRLEAFAGHNLGF